MKIGFIGQGYVGKNMANDFESRGYSTVRYALEPEYVHNQSIIAECDIVFIAVPTPTTPEQFDDSIVREAVKKVGAGKIAVIKSTVLPGTTKKVQDENVDKVVLFSPEFLLEATAAYDAAHPMLTIIGMAYDSAGHRQAAKQVSGVLPDCNHNFILRADAAELFKYIHNVHGYMRVVLSNLLFDFATKINVDWSDVKLIMDIDPMMSPYYNTPVHKGGRGAGGNCFIKDMAAFSRMFKEVLHDDVSSHKILDAIEQKNIELLALTRKDEALVRGVYGEGNYKK